MSALVKAGMHRMSACLPVLWSLAAASALDEVLDIKLLFLPLLAALAVVSGHCLVRGAAK